MRLATIAWTIVLLFVYSYRWLPSPDEARELAVGTFERYAQWEKFDPQLFEGPRAVEIGGAAYAFEWTYTVAPSVSWTVE